MRILQEGGYTVHVCTDIIEWAKEFYDMPDGAILANEEEVSKKCMGFAQPDGKLIWIFIPDVYDLRDLKETIAHEVGHIVEGGFKKNPAARMLKLNELKANHYMDFYMLVDKIVSSIINILERNNSLLITEVERSMKQFRDERMERWNIPFHYDAEGWGAMTQFIEWLKTKNK